MSTPTTKTPDQVRAEFKAAGVGIAEWARANNVDRFTVFHLLNGHLKGARGEAHRVAVALGLKAGRVVDPAKFKPVSPQPGAKRGSK